MQKQLMNDFLNLSPCVRSRIQRELDITFHQGDKESVEDFAKRVLFEIERAGKVRQLECLLSEKI